jgi:hypothetical protein
MTPCNLGNLYIIDSSTVKLEDIRAYSLRPANIYKTTGGHISVTSIRSSGFQSHVIRTDSEGKRGASRSRRKAGYLLGFSLTKFLDSDSE